MKVEAGPAALLAALGIAVAVFTAPAPQPEPQPQPEPRKPVPAPVRPAPRRPAPPSPAPQPRCPNCPQAAIGNYRSPDGAELLQLDLPGTRHTRNRGGSDQRGLCVFASMRHTGDWQQEPAFYDLFEFMFTKPGGGYPEKVDAMLRSMCAQKGYTIPEYFHVRDNDLDVLRLATANGLMPGVSYHRSATGRYNGEQIAHMVSLVHATDNWFCILDNNYPGEDQYEWLTPREFTNTYANDGTGWAIVLLTPPPPPAPHNGEG